MFFFWLRLNGVRVSDMATFHDGAIIGDILHDTLVRNVNNLRSCNFRADKLWSEYVHQFARETNHQQQTPEEYPVGFLAHFMTFVASHMKRYSNEEVHEPIAKRRRKDYTDSTHSSSSFNERMKPSHSKQPKRKGR